MELQSLLHIKPIVHRRRIDTGDEGGEHNRRVRGFLVGDETQNNGAVNPAGHNLLDCDNREGEDRVAYCEPQDDIGDGYDSCCSKDRVVVMSILSRAVIR